MYPELLIVNIQPYTEDRFIHDMAVFIINACLDNSADTAVMRSVRCFTTDAEEFIKGCAEVVDNEIQIEFLDEPWLNTNLWQESSFTGSEEYRNVVQATYKRLEEVAKRYSDARETGKKTAEKRGTHPGPKKGSYSKHLPLKEERMKKILELSPTFNKTDRTEASVFQELKIPQGSYYRYIGDLKKMYPDRVRNK